MRVRAYWNSHLKAFSIQLKHDVGWRVHSYVEPMEYLVLNDVSFKVSETGRQKVLRTHVKNVHAYIIGDVQVNTKVDNPIDSTWIKINYDPYVCDQFYTDCVKCKVQYADQVVLMPSSDNRAVVMAKDLIYVWK